MHAPTSRPESRRLLEKLIRESARAEVQAVDHPVREARRIGEAPPVLALREVALHAAIMRPRFEHVVRAHDLAVRSGLGATLSTLRNLVTDRVIDDERSFRTALLDLRHGLDVVKLMREVARCEPLFGVIRWCDDWLAARRTLVARVEAQLAWYAQRSMGGRGARRPRPEPAPSRTEDLAREEAPALRPSAADEHGTPVA